MLNHIPNSHPWPELNNLEMGARAQTRALSPASGKETTDAQSTCRNAVFPLFILFLSPLFHFFPSHLSSFLFLSFPPFCAPAPSSLVVEAASAYRSRAMREGNLPLCSVVLSFSLGPPLYCFSFLCPLSLLGQNVVKIMEVHSRVSYLARA